MSDNDEEMTGQYSAEEIAAEVFKAKLPQQADPVGHSCSACRLPAEYIGQSDGGRRDWYACDKHFAEVRRLVDDSTLRRLMPI